MSNRKTQSRCWRWKVECDTVLALPRVTLASGMAFVLDAVLVVLLPLEHSVKENWAWGAGESILLFSNANPEQVYVLMGKWMNQCR